MHTIRLYYDPISPYVWLALRQLARIPAQIELQPVLFAGLLNAHGQKGPAEIPAKRRYTFTDVMRLAAQQGLPFRGPPGHPFNPLQALRMCSAVAEPAARLHLATAFSVACWEQGQDLSDAPSLRALADGCGLDGTGLLEASKTPAIKQALIAATDDAIAAGVFGVPSFALGEELFWGADRIDTLIARLEGKQIDHAILEAFLNRPAQAVRDQKPSGLSS